MARPVKFSSMAFEFIKIVRESEIDVATVEMVVFLIA